MNEKNDVKKTSFLARFAGAFLIASALFAIAAIVAFGSLGRNSEAGWSFAILGLLCLAGWYFGRRGAVPASSIAGDKYSRQRTLLGFNAVLSVLVFAAVLAGVNYIATRRHKVFDLTKNRINSLAPQTHNALQKLKNPVKMTYVWAAGPEMPQPDVTAQSVLEAYKSASDKVRVEYFNAYQDPLRVQQMKLNTFSGQPLLLVEPLNEKGESAGTARQEVAVLDEQNITSALMKLEASKPLVLYFLSGHGELSPTQAAGGMGSAINGVRAALEAQNYTLKNLSLVAAKSQIPSDAAALLVIAPQVDLSAAEETKLKSYIARKGRLVILMQTPGAPLPRWKNVLGALQLQMLDGVVLEFDPSRMAQSTPQYIIGVLEPSRHALLRGTSADVIFPGVTPLKVKPAPPGSPGGSTPLVTPLFETSQNSQNVVLQGSRPRQGEAGPLVIAAAVEKTAEAGGGLRAVVVGNATFVSDAVLNQFGNSSFFLSSVNWVVGNDALVSIPPKEPVTNSLAMTESVQRFAILFSLFTLPILLLMIGTVVWWKRR